ncbi:MAG TPA: DUF1214 domain-containing protein [Acidimicrobiales bacterium]|nr:DUF1214 domain-containing protein [Acidimicrobiales bacterium]
MDGNASFSEHGDELDGAFDAFVDQLRHAVNDVRASPAFADSDNRVGAYMFVLSMLLARIEEDVIFDPDFPYFRSVDVRVREAGDNPDQRYWTSRLRGGETYRVWGNRGTARRVDVQVYAGVPSQPGGGRSAGFLPFEELHIEPDGSFEVYVSPESHASNWIDCPADATRIFVRQVYSDWETDLPGEVHVDRVGHEGTPKPSIAAADMASRLIHAADNLRSRVDLWPKVVETYSADGANRLSTLFDPGSLGGVHGRLMANGAFDLEPDQALIVRLWPGSGNYMGIQLGDPWFSSLEYANRQSSLSADQARPATDGTFWFVIARTDPGTTNWLDTAGRSSGFILVRYDGIVGGSARPRDPNYQVVTLDDVWSVLPTETERMTSVERGDALARRRRHVQRRYGI